jgi:hypothetical protein
MLPPGPNRYPQLATSWLNGEKNFEDALNGSKLVTVVPQWFSELQTRTCRLRAVTPFAQPFRVLPVGPMQPYRRSLQ